MGILTRACKHAVASVLRRSGLLRLLRPRLLPRGPLILMYHRVLPKAAGRDYSEPGLVVSAPTFAKQVRVLERHFTLATLSECEKGGGRGRGKPLCILTFDDGWADNYHVAFPILKSRGAAAVLFLASAHVDQGRVFWPERFIRALSGKIGRLPAAPPEGVPKAHWNRVLAAKRSLRAGDALMELIAAAKEWAPAEREILLQRLEDLVEAGGLPGRLINWEQARALRRAGWDVGSHTRSHAILTRVSPEVAREELRLSREEIGRALGEEVRYFAYPNGADGEELAEEVRAAGYTLALSTRSPFLPPPRRHADLRLPRKNVSENHSRGIFGFSESVFLCEILGVFDRLRLLARRSRRFRPSPRFRRPGSAPLPPDMKAAA